MRPPGTAEAVEIAMPVISLRHRPFRLWLAVAIVAAALAVPASGRAQVVVIANGSPITELDIQQRTKLIVTSTPNHKAPSRQEVINDLIDDRLKIAKAKTYSFEISEEEVDAAFETMAKRQRITPQQFTQVLDRSGISTSTVKARIRAELTWSQLMRGKFSSSLQIGDSDVADALRGRNESESPVVGYIYKLYPVTFVVDRGSNEAAIEAKRREAENLRARFVSCNEGLAMTRALRNVAVREPISRSSADLAPQLRDLLGNTQVGRLTTPEVTQQGVQMFALCEKKETKLDTPVKREVREELFTKKFEAESKKFLEEIRKSAMIEYKK